jgi:1-deoxy-D-xylulose-5-phosphate reductoisomerase
VKNITILGSTGSIGTNTLALVEAFGDRFAVAGLAAGANTSLLLMQVEKFRPKIVSLKTKEEAEKLRDGLKNKTVRVVYGSAGAEEVARFEENEIVVSAITGIEGLRPTLAAVRAGLRVALANKE